MFHRLNRRPQCLLTFLFLSAMLAGTSGVSVAQQSTPDMTMQPVNILLLGSDARPGEAIDAVRSDIMVVLHLDPTSGACRMLSIPRDTRVDIPGVGFTKINHALMQGGVPMSTATVEGFLGIDIDHYGLIDFAGAAQVVDAIGGVTIANDEAFAIGSHTFPLGEQTLSGSEAVLFARYRGGADGDFGRMHRQQMVFQGLVRELGSASVPEILQAALGTIGSNHVMTDLAPEMLLTLASTFGGSCTSETLVADTIPDETQGMMWDDLFGQELWFVIVDPAIVQQKVDALINGR